MGETVLVIGGGAAGALAAIQLGAARSRVIVIEPADSIGRGVAYATPDPEHLMNVRAQRLSAFADRPEHFVAWAQSQMVADGSSFVPRSLFGRYLEEQTAEVEHVRATAVDVRLSGNNTTVLLNSGHRLRGERVVLAPGGQPPRWPAGLGGGGHRFIENPWAPEGFPELDPDQPVLVLGTGLTAVDVSISLYQAGHRRIVAISRHGYLPMAHPPEADIPVEYHPPDCRSARALLRWARDQADATGQWGPVLDALRPHIDELWASSPAVEQLRLLRLLRRQWEILRHRMAPATAARIKAMRDAGELEVIAGRVGHLRLEGRTVTADLGGSERRFGTVINCTGPPLDVRRTPQLLIRQLLRRGQVVPSAFNLGLEADDLGRLPGTDGRISLVGPLRRGRRWETTAISDIREQAALMAGAGGPLIASIGA